MSNKNSENTNMLNNRLDFNAKYSSADFLEWLFGILGEIDFDSVLDAGCGSGKQTFWFSDRLDGGGQVCSFDISEKSIADINSKKLANVEAVVGSFDDIEGVLNSFSVKKFDLIHSSYAMYYAKKPLYTLRSLLPALKDDGKMAVCAPYAVNSFLDFLSQFQKIGQLNWDCMEFINDTALIFAHNNFSDVRTHIFVNNMRVTELDDLMQNYKSSTFYDASAEKNIASAAKKIIDKNGFFHIQKKSKIVVASDKILRRA